MPTQRQSFSPFMGGLLILIYNLIVIVISFYARYPLQFNAYRDALIVGGASEAVTLLIASPH